MSIFPRLGSKNPRQAKPSSFQLKDELIGISLVTMGLLVFLSVWSFSATDRNIWVSMTESDSSLISATTDNLVGIAGATIAFGLTWLVGWAAYAVSFFIILQGVRAFQVEPWSSRIRGLVGAFLDVVCLSAFFNLYLRTGLAFSEPGQLQKGDGGVVGEWMATTLTQYFAPTGTIILLGAGLLVSLLLIKPLSLVSTAALTAQRAAGIFPILRAMAGVFSSIRFPKIEQGRRVKANKPVKINRSLAKHGGVFSFLKNDEAREEELSANISNEEVWAETPEEITAVDVDRDQVSPKVHRRVSQGYIPPNPLELLEPSAVSNSQQTDQILESQSRILTVALQSFGIGGKVTEVHPGPVITMYEFEPKPGIKVARIVTLAHDLAMALKATSVRIVAPLPGKSTVGIEVPNPDRETVSLRDILTSDPFIRSQSQLALALGKDIFGRSVVADLKTMPHLLVAGATGAGKSVGLNSMLLSILFSAHPDEVKLLLVDPKVLELQIYDGIPHLLRPVITNPKGAARGLTWVVQEMERRYRLLAEHGVRNIQAFNLKMAKSQEQVGPPAFSGKQQQILPLDDSLPNDSTEGGECSSDEEIEQSSPPEPLPYIVVVIDEFADLMMVAPKEIEEKIARLAQMARASGIHLILATQRPSVDVVTGLIKANFPARIAYQVSSKIDSRTILDANGAEALLGLGDMLYMASGTGRIARLHGSYVSDEDVRRVVEWIKAQAGPAYSEEPESNDFHPQDDEESRDETYEQARELILSTGQASASLIQRRLRVGYPRAARMIEQMEAEGLVSAPGRDGRREVIGRRMMKEGVG